MTSPFAPRQGGDGRYFHGEDYKGDGVFLNAVIFGGIGALAGYRFYERWKAVAASEAEILGASMRHGALMAIRWKAWFVTTIWWVVTTPLWIVLSTGILDTVLDEHPDALTMRLSKQFASPGDYQIWLHNLRDINVTGSWFHGVLPLVWAITALHIVVGFLAIGATYNKHITESEFKQRWFFRQMRWLDPMVAKIDWKILQSLVVVPIVLAIASYNQ